jgi:peroxiredoxin Q/BCP
MTTLTVGDKAPLFTLRDAQDKDVSLANYIGKKNLVVYFYPKASTPGCTVQACGIRDNNSAFADENTAVFGISPDKPASLAKFADKQNLNFSLLSDIDHTVAEQYGAWGLKKFMGREYMGILRSTFIIGKDGKIAAIMPKVNTKTHAEDVLKILKNEI